MSQIASDEILDRTFSALDEIYQAVVLKNARAVLISGRPQFGKTELLRLTYDRLFSEQGRTLPIYFDLQPSRLSPKKFAHDFLVTLLRQYLAFVNHDADLILRDELNERDWLNLASATEYAALNDLIEGFEARLKDEDNRSLVQYTLGLPQRLASRSSYHITVLLDEAQWLARIVSDEEIANLFSKVWQQSQCVSFILTGQQRPLLDQLATKEDCLGKVKLLHVGPPELLSLQALVKRWCVQDNVAFDPEIGRLAVHQLDSNLFYLRSLTVAASERKLGFDKGADFERLYVTELLQGRIAHYFSRLLRQIASAVSLDQGEDTALEIIYICAEAMASRVPSKLVKARLAARFDVSALLVELHRNELITLLNGHILPSEDTVFCDWIVATHRRFEGASLEEVKLDLLRRRIKSVPNLLVLSARRSLHAQIEALLRCFDGQSVAHSLFAHDEFVIRYGHAPYEIMLAGLKAEIEKVQLPQIVHVADGHLFGHQLASLPATWSCLLAFGFEQGIYDQEHEVIWLLAIAELPSAVNAEAVQLLDQQLREIQATLFSNQAQGKSAPHIVRWAISKLGFTPDGTIALAERSFATADYLQLELLTNLLDIEPKQDATSEDESGTQLPSQTENLPESVSAAITATTAQLHPTTTEKNQWLNQFEMVIPTNDDKEIIAARAVERMARSAGFSPEAVAQIKTALIEACLSLAAAEEQPNTKIYQRYQLDEEKMTITLANIAVGLDDTAGTLIAEDPERIWRLEVLRSLVDFVRLTKLADGWRVELTRFIPLDTDRRDTPPVRQLTGELDIPIDIVAVPETNASEISDEGAAPVVTVSVTPDLPVAKPFAQDEANDFEVAIPINDDKEIISARVAERVARSAGFTPEAVNQIKTALIEACLSFAAAEESPDGKIYQRYQVDEEKMMITLSNSASGLGEMGGTIVVDDPEQLWRLNVLRSLVDFVRLIRLEAGWRVDLTRFIPQGGEDSEDLNLGNLTAPHVTGGPHPTDGGTDQKLPKVEDEAFSFPDADNSPGIDNEIMSPQWLAAQQTLAASTNLSLVTVTADNDLQKTVANETSICQSFLNDPATAPMCAEYCGKARARAIAAERVITYRCGANLHCFAAPLQVPGKKDWLVLIGGHTFLSVNDYSRFLQREMAGGNRPHPKLFSNIKFTEAEEFDRHQQMILTTASEVLNHPFSAIVEELPLAPKSRLAASIFSTEQLETFLKKSFEHGCREALHLIGSQFQISSGVLLMRTGRRMAACAAGGERREQLIVLSLNADSLLLARLQLRANGVVSSPLTTEELIHLQIAEQGLFAEAFPLFVGEDLAGILLVLETGFDDATRQDIARLGQTLIVPLELARLRDAVNEQTRSLAQWQDFSHLLATRANAPETYSAIVEKVVAALGAERVSLLIYNEDSGKLLCKGSSGLGEEILNAPRLGEGIAGIVLERGEPLLVRDLREQSWVAERAHGNAHSHSFISFPLLSGSKRLGVINLTDRVNDQSFTASDLDWLRTFAPYAASAMEKIDLHEKAQRLQLLAITDTLTGLLNRRYLEERFAQEIERSKRYQFPLSFVMIDIDSFKSFNDAFGHTAGDEVLRETAHCLRRSLRNFDIAARYGGEEFIVVLPETDVTSATTLAERLRKAVEQHFKGEGARHPVTISLGVSSLSKTLQNRQQVIRAADQALFAAKKRGKNCVVVYNTELVPGLA